MLVADVAVVGDRIAGLGTAGELGCRLGEWLPRLMQPAYQHLLG